MRKVGGLVGLVLLLAVEAAGQASVSLDPQAVFKTHVPHLSVLTNRAAAPAGQAMQTAAAAAAFSGSPYIVGATVAATTTMPAAEEHIAVDPNNPSNLVAAISDFSRLLGFNTTKFAVSTDGGATWRESFIPLDDLFGLFPATGDGNFWLANSDPVVAIDRIGNVYLVDLYLDAIDNGNGLYVSVGTVNGGVGSFSVANTFPVLTNPDPSTSFLEDKPWITVDNCSNPVTTGTVYVAWSHFTDSVNDVIALSGSLDHGRTWTSPLQISLPSQTGAVQGAQVAVGPNGEVYVAYEVFFSGSNRQQFLAKSTDGGQTFSAPVAITPVFNEVNFNSTYRINSLPNLAVGPMSGNVYVVYPDTPSPATGAEVEFIRSTDGGTTFSAPMVINDNPAGQQFMPAVTVDSAEVIHASWFDTRNSSGSTALYDVFATYSRDAGSTFATNARVTAALEDAGTSSFIGDYAGIAAAANTAHPVWTNGGANSGRLQTATLTLP